MDNILGMYDLFLNLIYLSVLTSLKYILIENIEYSHSSYHFNKVDMSVYRRVYFT